MIDVNELKGKKVLVTGGSGFFPSHLVAQLKDIGAEITVLTRYNSIFDNVRLSKIWNDINIIEADLRNTDSLKQVKDIAPEYIYHFAAYNHVGDSFLHVQEAMNVNAVGTANLMEAYSDYKRFVYISTSEVYGHQETVPFEEKMTPFPTSPYAVGKYAGELYAQMQHHVYERPITMIRPFNVFGPYQSPRAIIAEMIIKCLKGETIRSTEGIQTRDFNFVKNLAEGVLMASLAENTVGKMLNIGSGREITIKDLILKIHEATDSKSKLEIGALDYRPTEIWRMQACSETAKELFSWEPKLTFEEGLKETVDWYRQYIEVFENEASPLNQLFR